MGNVPTSLALIAFITNDRIFHWMRCRVVFRDDLTPWPVARLEDPQWGFSFFDNSVSVTEVRDRYEQGRGIERKLGSFLLSHIG